ncbi:sensor histidine kinase [Microbacteriaceae bacterium 4G12]
MISFLVIIIVILLGIIYFQHKRKKARSADLIYTYKKLQSIITTKSSEKLLVVTDDKELQNLLSAMNRLLDENQKMIAHYTKAEDSMRKMLSNISHDLKTPLTVILGYIEILTLNNTMSSEEKALLLKVHTKTLEVLGLIHKFFDLAKLEAGDKEISITRVNVSEICRKKILSFYDMLIARDLEVCIDIPETNIYALGNEEMLERILNNLLSNAITYGSDGNVVGLTLRNDEEFVYIDVWDRGKGIDELHIDRVFERMYTLEDSRNKSYQGSGLGLTITKRLVEQLGGNIRLFSKPYEKTVFSFSLKRLTF